MFKVLGNKLFVDFVPSQVTSEVGKIYKLAIKKKLITTDSICTVNGIQTSNIANLFYKSYIGEILANYTSEYLEQYYSCNTISMLSKFEFVIHNLHIIKYNNGYQNKHNHSWNEDHSFILYLNNADGSTRFYNDITPYDIEPEANKIVFFNSADEHEGLPTKNKFILVGGIRVNKEWG